MTKIYYYISPSGENFVKNFIDSLSETQQRKVSRIFAYITEFGLGSHILNVKKLSSTNLWEIRILGKDNIRVIYAVIYKGDVLVLNGFVKKKQKTPNKEIQNSQNRLSEWLKSRVLTK